jgi:DNA-binding NarL/FixJ family response regulator
VPVSAPVPTPVPAPVSAPVPVFVPVRVFLQGGSPIVRAGLAAMLATRPDLVVVVRRLQSVASPGADLVLVDIDDRDASGRSTSLGSLRHLVAAGVVGIALSWRTDPQLVRDVMGLGAAGFLHKGIGADDLACAMVSLHLGTTVVTP